MNKHLITEAGMGVCVAITSGGILLGAFAVIFAFIFNDIKQIKFRGALRQEQMLMQHELEMNELKLRNAAFKEALENFNSKQPEGGER